MRIPKCSCPNCNNVGTHKVLVYRRGAKGYAYMCDYHYNREESYFTKNDNKVGTRKVNATTIGVEFETSYSTEKARIEFMQSNYLPTHDTTVDVEYKSPIMNGLNSLSKHCVTFERLVNDGQLEINNSCGTHLHVGNTDYLNRETLQYIRRFYHSLFIPLQEVMKENHEATKQLFGRGFGYWCNTIDEYTDATNHTNFINMQHDYTIEFRMCKFVNAKQYMTCAKFCVAVVNCIIENFVKHFNDTDFDKTRYKDTIENGRRVSAITNYRRHKARVTAQKLVKLFEKQI